ncbi:PKD domain-containing protein [bacterium]|nr:PKD domain-containing protein [bacterium]
MPLALSLGGCAGGNAGEVADLPNRNLPEPDRLAGQFDLNVWDESHFDGARADGYSLLVSERGGETVVIVSVSGAVELKALYFDLGYDPERYRPIKVEPGGALDGGDGWDDLLTLEVFEERGRVYYGQVLARYQEKDGFSGSGVLASVHFMRERAPFTRLASEAPISDASAADLAWEGDNDILAWHYYSQGDYDQNGETNVADLTRLGANFGVKGPFDPTTSLALIDGDGNGELSITDLTPIGVNFRRVVGSYNIYGSASETDYPAGNEEGNGAGAVLLGSVDFAEAVGTPAERKQFSFEVGDPEANLFYWVRPADGGHEGTPSNLLEWEPFANDPPVAGLIPNPSAGDFPLTVNLSASTSSDPDGEIVLYEWDFEGDGVFEQDSGADPFIQHVYLSSGTFEAAVRVTDDHGGVDIAQTTIEVGTGEFELGVYGETYLDGGGADAFVLTMTDGQMKVTAEISASGASGLKAFYFNLSYDPFAFTPDGVTVGEGLGSPPETLTLSTFSESGIVYAGQVLIHPQDQEGFSGDLVLAHVEFAKAPDLGGAPLVAPPFDNRSAAPLIWDNATSELSWSYYNTGDYRQDGQVHITDLTPPAIHWEKPGPFNPDSIEGVVDADGSGTIQGGDLDTITMAIWNIVDNYKVFRSLDPGDYPLANSVPNGPGTILLGTVPLSQAAGDPSMERLTFNFTVLSPLDNAYYWVRPEFDDIVGTPSNLAGQNLPQLSLTNHPITGSGKNFDPYIADVATDYQFALLHPDDGDVTNDPATIYFVNDPSAGSIDTADAILNIADAYQGIFKVSATYQGITNRIDTDVYMRVVGEGEALYIMPDLDDPDWVGVVGTGTLFSRFDLTPDTEYSFIANTKSDGSGDEVDVENLAWEVFPSFTGSFPSDGVFSPNFLTEGYIFAEDALMRRSNFTYFRALSSP